MKVRVKAADMPPILQERAFRCARQCLDSMDKLNSKRVALILKKEFDTSYGPCLALHCWNKLWIICYTFSGRVLVLLCGQGIHSPLQNYGRTLGPIAL